MVLTDSLPNQIVDSVVLYQYTHTHTHAHTHTRKRICTRSLRSSLNFLSAGRQSNFSPKRKPIRTGLI